MDLTVYIEFIKSPARAQSRLQPLDNIRNELPHYPTCLIKRGHDTEG